MTVEPEFAVTSNWVGPIQPKSSLSVAGLKATTGLAPQFQVIVVVVLVVAAGLGACPVVTLAASGARNAKRPARAAASTIHPTGDSAGTPVPSPSRGEGAARRAVSGGVAVSAGAAADAGATTTAMGVTSTGTTAAVLMTGATKTGALSTAGAAAAGAITAGAKPGTCAGASTVGFAGATAGAWGTAAGDCEVCFGAGRAAAASTAGAPRWAGWLVSAA